MRAVVTTVAMLAYAGVASAGVSPVRTATVNPGRVIHLTGMPTPAAASGRWIDAIPSGAGWMTWPEWWTDTKCRSVTAYHVPRTVDYMVVTVDTCRRRVAATVRVTGTRPVRFRWRTRWDVTRPSGRVDGPVLGGAITLGWQR